MEKKVCTRPMLYTGTVSDTLFHDNRSNRSFFVPIQRIKTDFIGVYYRFGKNRILPNKEPDRCYDICFQKANGQMTYEKVGWVSEGYSVEDAIKIRGQRIREIRHPELFVPPGTPTLTLSKAWAAYKTGWLPNLKRADDVVRIYKKYLQKEFGNRVIASVTPQEIEEFKQRLLTQTSRFGTPLKPGSVRLILAHLRRIIAKALEWNMAPAVKNPASGFRVPSGADRRREKYLTPEEADRLLADLQLISCDMYDAASIGLHTGMRLAEILGLHSDDMDFTAYVIHIRDGKTGSRLVYFPEELASLLKKRVQRCAPDSHLLFFTVNGNPVNPKWFSYQFSSTVTDMGFNRDVSDSLYKVTFHTLRHTFCSWLAMNGVSAQIIGELAGHSQLEMTQRYTKLASEVKRAELKCIRETLLSGCYRHQE